MEPKCGKLHKLGLGLFGPKWTEKWVHLDGTQLKCFPMAVEQQVFSLGSSRQSSSYELTDYKFVVADEKKTDRKFTFQLESKEKSSKTVTFACSSGEELAEWRLALTSRLCLPAEARVSSMYASVTEKIRRAAEAFSERIFLNIELKLGDFITIDRSQTFGENRRRKTAGGKDSEFTLMQQQLDLGHHGFITRTRLLTWLQSYYCAQEVMDRVKAEHVNNQIAAETTKAPEYEKDLPNYSRERVSALESPGETDWNQRFYGAHSKESPTDVFAVGSEVSSVLAEFRQAAEILIKDIVAEMVLEDGEKTLRSQTLQGDEFFATDGSQQFCTLLSVVHKYHRNGLLAYLCSNNASNGVFHDKQQQEAMFHRMAGHQLRAAKVIQVAIEELNSSIQQNRQNVTLQVPLQCTVDHLGFRAFVIASSQPMLKSTRHNLVGQVQKNHAEKLHDQLTHVLDKLGLLADGLGSSTVEHHGSLTDTPVPDILPVSVGFSIKNRNSDAEFKLQNLAEVIPADASSDGSGAMAHEALLYKIRPEFVRMHGNSFLPRANTLGSTEEEASAEQRVPNKFELDVQLLQQSPITARECLHGIAIPEFVADLENATVQVIDSPSLTRALHGAGINMRYLASCYELASLKHIRRVLLTEMVARVCKVELRAALRTIPQDTAAAILRQAKEPRRIEDWDADGQRKIDLTTVRALARLALQEETSQVTVEFFNLVLGISSPDSKVYWEERILPHMHTKFGISHEALCFDTIVSEDLLHLPQLFHALQFQTGVCCADHMNYNFKGAEPLAFECIQSISPSTKLLARTTAECEKMLENSDSFIATRDYTRALSNIIMHISILETAPSDERNLSLCHLLTCAANISLAMDLPDQAKNLIHLAIQDSPRNHAELIRAYTILMKLKHASGGLTEVRENFTKALVSTRWHLGSLHPLFCDTYMTMSEILSDLGEPEQAVEVLQGCVEIVRASFGKTSLLYADIRRRQGILMLSVNHTDREAIIGVLEDALSAYEKHFQDPVEDVPICKESAAECCYLLATLRAQVSGVQGAEVACGIALTGLALRKEVLPPNHEDMMKSFLQLGYLCRDLGELYRAVDYFKPALSILKTMHDDEHIDEIRSVTQTMLQLHLQTLTSEKRSVSLFVYAAVFVCLLTVLEILRLSRKQQSGMLNSGPALHCCLKVLYRYPKRLSALHLMKTCMKNPNCLYS
ncbi:hypothetical protein P3T76_002965 [Phytophthora citrophthora]|uniref:PH domain-containing protein n=1 Tax=Phytophthora citrophthora TaxID=4793 RepID=A0AAD9GW79_9STRA|nr:hypothetical protein P3T76_002965 [Phytophthora citrophthora]